MIEAPRILRTEDQPCAIIHLLIPSSEIQKHMGPALNEIGEVLKAQRIPPTGPWFTRHLKVPDTHFDFETSIPTATAIAPADRVVPSVWPATTLAHTVYHGNYSWLVAAWGESCSGSTPTATRSRPPLSGSATRSTRTTSQILKIGAPNSTWAWSSAHPKHAASLS